MKITFLILSVFILSTTLFSQGSEQSIEVSAIATTIVAPKPKQCKNGKIITPESLTAARIPLFKGAESLPPQCKLELARLKKKWIEQDYSEWEKLSNQFCSHEEGWIEINPGTCSAGGPPPICVANHWVRDATNAKDIWNKEQKAVRNRREAELKNAMCECWSGGEQNKLDKEENELLKSYQLKNDYKIPCGAGCPVGYTCNNGFCEEDNPAINLNETVWNNNAVSANKQYGKFGLIVEKLVNKFNATASKMYNLRTADAQIGNTFNLISQADAGAQTQSYFAAGRRLGEVMNKTYSLTQELLRSKNDIKPCNCRDIETVYNELTQQKQQLTVEYDLFNNAYGEFKNTQELFNTICPNIYDVYHKQLNEYFNLFNNIPLPEVPHAETETIYDKDGIVVTLTTKYTNTVYCEDQKATLYHYKYKFTISNQSADEAGITFNYWTPTDFGLAQCGLVVPISDPAIEAGTRTYSGRLKPGDAISLTLDNWLYSILKPGWNIAHKKIEDSGKK